MVYFISVQVRFSSSESISALALPGSGCTRSLGQNFEARSPGQKPGRQDPGQNHLRQRSRNKLLLLRRSGCPDDELTGGGWRTGQNAPRVPASFYFGRIMDLSGGSCLGGLSVCLDLVWCLSVLVCICPWWISVCAGSVWWICSGGSVWWLSHRKLVGSTGSLVDLPEKLVDLPGSWWIYRKLAALQTLDFPSRSHQKEEL